MSRSKLTSHALKLFFVLLAIGLIWFSYYVLPIMAEQIAADSPVLEYLVTPMLVVCYVLVIVFLIAIVCAIYLLVLIDQDKIFSDRANMLLNVIKGAALLDTLIMLAILFYLDRVDILAPLMAVLLVGLITVGVIISLFVILLQHILKEVIRIKTENDLTV